MNRSAYDMSSLLSEIKSIEIEMLRLEIQRLNSEITRILEEKQNNQKEDEWDIVKIDE